MAIKFPLAVVITGEDHSLERALGRVNLRLRAFGQLATSVGRGLTLGVTGPLTALGGAALYMGTQIQQNLLAVRAAGNFTAEQSTVLQQASRNYADLGVGARGASEGMVAFAKAGLSVDQILNAMSPTVRLAKSQQMDFGETSQGVVNVITGYRKQFAETSIVTDQLVYATDATTNSLTELFEAFKIGGPTAAGAGQKFEETLAVLSLMGHAGFRATLGGTAMRGFMTDLGNFARGGGTFDQAQILKRWGIAPENLRKSSGAMIGMVEALELLEDVSQRGNAELFSTELTALFGERAGPGILAVLGQGTAAVRGLARQLAPENVLGTNARKYEQIMSGAKGATERLRASLENLADSVARGGLLDAFTSVVNKATEWVRVLDKASPETKELWVKFGLGLAVLGPMALAIGKVTTAVMQLRAAYILLSTAQLGAAGTAAAGGAAAAGAGGAAAAAGGAGRFAKFLGPLAGIAAFATIGDDLRQQGDAMRERLWRGTREGRRFGYTFAEQKVTVQFKNTPQGTRVDASSAPTVDLDVGYAMAAP